MKEYIVNREHQGDRFYKKGDTRKVTDPSVVKHLVDNGVLSEKKVDEDHLNKAEPGAEENMAESSADENASEDVENTDEDDSPRSKSRKRRT